MFTIVYAESVADDLAAIRVFDRKRILDQIDRQLVRQPTQETRNKKILRGLTAPWTHVPPVWELRAGEYRVFYDVDDAGQRVIIRAIRRKPLHQMTEDML